MTRAASIQTAGWAGVGAVVLYSIGFGLYLAAGQPPVLTNAPSLMDYVRNHATLFISSGLVFSVNFALLLVWFVGVRDLIRAAGNSWRSVADISMYAYVAGLAMAFVAMALLIAAVTAAWSLGDPSATRILWFAGFTALGAVNYVLLAMVQALFALAVQRGGILPRWNAWIAWIAALGSVAAIPAAYGGIGFYSQFGLAPLLLSLPGLAWNLGASISMIRRGADAGG